MKVFYAVLGVGLILLYFLDAAFHIDSLTLEMLTHNLVRFFAGFGILGIWAWHQHKLEVKMSLYIILAFLISDDIFDYFRHIDNLNFEMLIHDVVVLFWGALAGFFFMRRYK